MEFPDRPAAVPSGAERLAGSFFGKHVLLIVTDASRSGCEVPDDRGVRHRRRRTCVGDAVNIGWRLAAVLQGRGGPALLDTYEAERRPVAAQTIADSAAQEKLLAPSFAGRPLTGEGAAADRRRAEVAAALRAKTGERRSGPGPSRPARGLARVRRRRRRADPRRRTGSRLRQFSGWRRRLGDWYLLAASV